MSFLVFFFLHKIRHFLKPFAENLMKTLKQGSLLEKVASFWPNRSVFMVFHKMRDFLQVFAENLMKILKLSGLFEKYCC